MPRKITVCCGGWPGVRPGRASKAEPGTLAAGQRHREAPPWSSASGRATTTRRSPREPTSTPATMTCSRAGLHWPGFTRSL